MEVDERASQPHRIDHVEGRPGSDVADDCRRLDGARSGAKHPALRRAALERGRTGPAVAPTARRPDVDPRRPAWIEEHEIDVDHHLRSAAVASPGSIRQVLDLVALFEVMPFDHEHPPWDMTCIEGLDGGRAAVYFRAHTSSPTGSAGSGSSARCSTRWGGPGTCRRSGRRSARSLRRPRATIVDGGTITIDLNKATGRIQEKVNAARRSRRSEASCTGSRSRWTSRTRCLVR